MIFLQLVKLCLGDGLNLFNDTPFDTFRARGRGEGTIIAPVVLHVNRAEELAHLNLRSGAIGIDSIKDTFDEGVCGGAALSNIKEDGNYGTWDFLISVQGVAFGSESGALDDVKNLHFDIVLISVNGVFRGCVEVEHLGSEVGFATVGELELEFSISAELILTKVELSGDIVSGVA